MLAPPVTRLGVKKPGRPQLSSQPQATIAETAEPVRITADDEVDRITTQTVPEMVRALYPPQLLTLSLQKSVPLMQRSVASIVFSVDRWLEFKDPVMESEFRKTLGEAFSDSCAKTALVLLTLFLLTIGLEIPPALDETSDSRQEAYSMRLGFAAASVLFSLALFLIRNRKQPFDSGFQRSLTVLFSLTGLTWVLSLTLTNDRLDLPLSAGPLLAFLFCASLLGQCLLFPYTLAFLGLMTAAFTICACVFKSAAEPWWRFAFEVAVPVLPVLALCVHLYARETTRRQLWTVNLTNLLAQQEKNQYKKEALDLRDNLYLMTLQYHGIADIEETSMDLKSPLEKAMAKLQGLQKKRANMPNSVFKELQEVMTLLGSSSDLFKPQIESEIATKNINMDTDTERWIFDLVGGEQGKGAERQRTEEPALHSIAEESGLPSMDRAQSSLPGMLAVSGPGPQPKSREERQFQELLDRMEDWNFDVFEVSALTSGKPLYFVGTALFKKYNLISTFNIDRNKLRNFLMSIEAGYQDAPYHNSTHAADVLRTVHFFLWTGKLRECMTDLELLGAIIAAAVHDVDHPGTTNQFHIAIREPKAILYNDRAVLENHHCAHAFFTLMKDENDITADIQGKDYNVLRKIIIDLVLATDLGQHFDFLSQFNAGSQTLDKGQEKSRITLLKMALKCGDLGHSAKTLPLHEKWTARITEEFYRQGDEERKRNIAISPFMDRQKANVPQAQVGFMDFLVTPMFKAWVPFMNHLSDADFPCLLQLRNNRDHWKAQLDLSTPATAGAKGAATGAPSGNSGSKSNKPSPRNGNA